MFVLSSLYFVFVYLTVLFSPLSSLIHYISSSTFRNSEILKNLSEVTAALSLSGTDTSTVDESGLTMVRKGGKLMALKASKPPSCGKAATEMRI
jgi:hypothetical protein